MCRPSRGQQAAELGISSALSRIEKKNNTALHLKTVMSNVQSQEGSTAYDKPFTEEMIMIDGGGGAARWPGKHGRRLDRRRSLAWT
uniref:Uncharacterized protein n=1 Tax=Oryza meridionalis TaxID=40149 RepID=A0A0E0CDR9_9ORYZ